MFNCRVKHTKETAYLFSVSKSVYIFRNLFSRCIGCCYVGFPISIFFLAMLHVLVCAAEHVVLPIWTGWGWRYFWGEYNS